MDHAFQMGRPRPQCLAKHAQPYREHAAALQQYFGLRSIGHMKFTRGRQKAFKVESAARNADSHFSLYARSLAAAYNQSPCLLSYTLFYKLSVKVKDRAWGLVQAKAIHIDHQQAAYFRQFLLHGDCMPAI